MAACRAPNDLHNGEDLSSIRCVVPEIRDQNDKTKSNVLPISPAMSETRDLGGIVITSRQMDEFRIRVHSFVRLINALRVVQTVFILADPMMSCRRKGEKRECGCHVLMTSSGGTET